MSFLLLLLVPILVSAGSFFLLKDTVTWKEFLLQLVVGGIACGVGWQAAKWGAIRDTEHLNGRITAKIADTQSCCHCTTVCDAYDKDRNCTSSHEVCSHTYDYYWDLQTSVGKISVEDCSGTDDPPSEWVLARVGEPAAIEHGYTNYLLADPDSLMVHTDILRFAQSVPEYPAVYGKYKVNHVIGDQPTSVRQQEVMREINADLGAPNQVDITLLLTGIQDSTYAQAVEAKWLYGPKNSITIVAGLQPDRVVKWVRVITFSKVEMLKVRLRDQLQGMSIDDPKTLDVIRQEIGQGFKRTHMADFEYLAATASPKGGSLALLILGELILSIALAVWSHAKDIFGDERANLFRSRYKGF